jgi:hypothetical protein
VKTVDFAANASILFDGMSALFPRTLDAAYMIRRNSMLRMHDSRVLVLALMVTACGDDTTNPSPAIHSRPALAVFAAEAGGPSPAAQTATVLNTGGGSLAGLTATVEYDGAPQGWLTVSLDGASAPATLTLTPATGALPDGSYKAFVVLTSPGARNTPYRMEVRFNIAFSDFGCVPQGALRLCTFRYRAPEGAPPVTAVSVPGEFNGWNPDGSAMTREGDVWSRSYTLAPGEYQYKYHINGNWIGNMCNDGTWGQPARDNWVHGGAAGCRGDNAYIVIE